MRYRVYSVLDKAVQAFAPPLMFRAEGEAIRSFLDAVEQEGSPFNKHKEDFAFCFLGFYDDSTGSFDCSPPKVVAEAATLSAATEGE